MTYGFQTEAAHRPQAYKTFESRNSQPNPAIDKLRRKAQHHYNPNYNYSSSITTDSHETSASPACGKIYETLTPEKSYKSDNSSINYEHELPRRNSCSKIINCLNGSNSQEYNQIYSSDLNDDLDDGKMLLSHNNIEIRSISNSNTADNSIAASIKSDEDIDTELSCCDIEQCLIQIEESLLNIEQNLLHVQNLEIPQLNNLLNNRFIINNYNRNNDYVNKFQGNPVGTYKRPSSENSKYNYNNYFDNSKSLVRNCLRLSHSDSDIDIEKNIYLNSPRHNCRMDNDDLSYNKYSSLLKKSQTLIEDNFKKIQLLSEIRSDFVNFNCSDSLGRSVKLINSKNMCNSFDNNDCNNYNFNDYDNDHDNEDYDIRRIKEISGKKKRINSLSNYFCKSNSLSTSSSLMNSRKISSQGAIEKFTRENGFKVRKKRRDVWRRSINNVSNDGLFNEINCKSDKLRKKFKSIATTKDIVMSFKKLQASNSKESKARNLIIQDFDCESKSEDDKKKLIDKPVKSSAKSQLQAHDNNALVPSKLLSLSFSLLLAALLQAVRCLADIVEDTFRSVTFDKYVLHE